MELKNGAFLREETTFLLIKKHTARPDSQPLPIERQDLKMKILP